VDDSEPPAKCAAPVKVLLMGIEDEAEPPSGAPPLSEDTPVPCPSGAVRRGAACVPAKTAGAHACADGNEADCSKQCSAGDAPSCATLGFMYEKGKGVALNDAKAFEHYDRACKKGDANGCTGVAFLYSKGRGVAADPALADKMLRDACDKGNARACSGLGHEARIGGKNDEAVRLLERSCKLGYERACFYAGGVLMAQTKDEARALKNYERACQGHDYRGCLALAGMLFSGLGGEANPARANKEQSRALNALTKECGAGDSEACTAMGDFYNGRYGKKVRNPQKALENYEKACKGGQASACADADAIKRE
jgi:TPR repeat protein